MFLQLDTDINSLPEGPAADLDQPRSADPGPLFPGQRLQAQAVATVASAAAAAVAGTAAPVVDDAGLSPAVTATEQHTLEPSPLLSPPGSTGATLSSGPSRSLTFAPQSPRGSGSGGLGAASSGTVHSGGPDATPALQQQQQQEVLFSAGVGVQAVRVPHGAGAGHPLRALPAQQAPEVLRRAAQEERAGAAAAAGAGARDERLAAARRDRSSMQEEPGGGGGDGAMLVDNPLLARLASFVRTGPGSGSAAAAAAAAREREEESTRSLLKNMSIEEVEAVHAIGVTSADRRSPTQ